MEDRRCDVCGEPAKVKLRGKASCADLPQFCGEVCFRVDGRSRAAAASRSGEANVLPGVMAPGDVYVTDIAATTLGNTAYRKILCTTPHMQVVAMTIGLEGEPRVAIGDGPTGEAREMHPYSAQLFRLEAGAGVVTVWDPATNVATEHELGGEVLVVVPAGTYHLITRTSCTPLQLYTVYSPPHHPPNT
jgi:mannose-6-phosphate isomerase-like protein (cupin superfamily)